MCGNGYGQPYDTRTIHTKKTRDGMLTRVVCILENTRLQCLNSGILLGPKVVWD